MTEEVCIVGDVVTFTSKRFYSHNDKTKIWFVIEKTNDCLILEADDSHLIKLSPSRGKHRVTIPSKYLVDCEIIKKSE
jgi:hypothetical protein